MSLEQNYAMLKNIDTQQFVIKMKKDYESYMLCT